MDKIVAALFLSAFISLTASAQTSSTTEAVPPNFKSDGCSMFPDADYKCCCVAHDLAYYRGGSIKERLRADNNLFKCVRRKRGWWHRIVAPVIWAGVRIGGVPFLPTSFRWGFGRSKQPQNSAAKVTQTPVEPAEKP